MGDDRAREIALRAMAMQNPRFSLYRSEDPTFREDDVLFWSQRFAEVLVSERVGMISGGDKVELLQIADWLDPSKNPAPKDVSWADTANRLRRIVGEG